MDIFETFVDPAARGHGIAGQVAAAAFEHCREQNWKVVPSCSYISGTFLDRNPKYKSLIEKV
jgi:predicted GNAT family acetyltransferase